MLLQEAFLLTGSAQIMAIVSVTCEDMVWPAYVNHSCEPHCGLGGAATQFLKYVTSQKVTERSRISGMRPVKFRIMTSYKFSAKGKSEYNL
jgi:hypothetical protein